MSAPIRASSKCISGAERMLEVEDVNLYYGAAIALRGMSRSTAESARSPACSAATASARPACCAPSSARSRSANGSDHVGRRRHHQPADATSARARGIAWVPQGRDIFPLLTVQENLETGFAVLPRGKRRVPDEIFELFPMLKTMLRRRGGDLSGGQQQQLAIAPRAGDAAAPAGAGRADRGHPAQHHQGYRPRDRAAARTRGDMAILLVEQYFDFARELAQTHRGDGPRRRRAGRPAGGARRSGCPPPPVGLSTSAHAGRAARGNAVGGAGTTVLADLRQAGCLKARFPRAAPAGPRP